MSEEFCTKNGVCMFISKVTKDVGKRPTPPSHKKIIDYYMKTENYENFLGWEVFDNIAECSLGEIFCWSCGVNCSKINRLERAHIIPHSLGGGNEPSNYMLLCSDCHIESPDTEIPDIFFNWLDKKKSNTSVKISTLLDIVDQYDMSVFNESLNEIIMEDMKNIRKTTHGAIASDSTIFLSLDYALSKHLDKK